MHLCLNTVVYELVGVVDGLSAEFCRWEWAALPPSQDNVKVEISMKASSAASTVEGGWGGASMVVEVMKRLSPTTAAPLHVYKSPLPMLRVLDTEPQQRPTSAKCGQPCAPLPCL